jgi:hypothetical protein
MKVVTKMKDLRVINYIKEKNRIEMYVDGRLENVRVTKHFKERLLEKCYGLNIEQLELLLRNGEIIKYNPEVDKLPDNINQQTIYNIHNKHQIYKKEIRFYLIPSEDIVLCITPNDWVLNVNDKTKCFPKWSLTTIWKNPLGIHNVEIKEREYVKVGGRRIYVNKNFNK